MTKNITFIIFMLFCANMLLAQNLQMADSLPRTATFGYDANGNVVQFNPKTPPLIPMTGAPEAYWTYYWEFGDGHYSRKKKPNHTYENKGNYEVNLWVTNHYDNGKTPATRPKTVEVDQLTETYYDRASMDGNFMLQRNREPIPTEEIVAIFSYKNAKNYTTNGRIYLFFNEKKYKYSNFELSDVRTYHGERQVHEAGFATTGKIQDNKIMLASAETEFLYLVKKWQDSVKTNLPLTLEQSKTYYEDWHIFEFDDMPPGEERNVFFTLRTTPKMLQDTSAIITVRGIYVPDRNFDNHQVKDMEMEIVTSYDPNKMASNATVMNYRSVRAKTFKFKIRFQNTGEGPARTIRLETEIPEMFDKKTIKIIGQYPECPICPENKSVRYSCIDTTFTKEKAIFTFNNIYLPGTQQENVMEMDSTKGFVKYKIELAKDFHKQKTKTRTAIYFDKNDPIYTDYAVTRFLPGISIGAKAGTMISPGRDHNREYFVGATISPYKVYRGYFQAELMVSSNSHEKIRQFTRESVRTNGFVDSYKIKESNEYQNISLYVVPISYHYNLNNFLAVEGGMQAKIDLSSKYCRQNIGEYSLVIPQESIHFRDDTKDFAEQVETTSSFVNFQAGAFVGFNAGFVRIGPSIGARYVFNVNAPHSQIQLYAIWKF